MALCAAGAITIFFAKKMDSVPPELLAEVMRWLSGDPVAFVRFVSASKALIQILDEHWTYSSFCEFCNAAMSAYSVRRALGDGIRLLRARTTPPRVDTLRLRPPFVYTLDRLSPDTIASDLWASDVCGVDRRGRVVTSFSACRHKLVQGKSMCNVLPLLSDAMVVVKLGKFCVPVGALPRLICRIANAQERLHCYYFDHNVVVKTLPRRKFDDAFFFGQSRAVPYAFVSYD